METICENLVIFLCLSFLSYNVCIRPEDGFCCIQYQVCSDAGSFSLSSGAIDPAIAADLVSKAEADCTNDYISIPGDYHLKIPKQSARPH